MRNKEGVYTVKNAKEKIEKQLKIQRRKSERNSWKYREKRRGKEIQRRETVEDAKERRKDSKWRLESEGETLIYKGRNTKEVTGSVRSELWKTEVIYNFGVPAESWVIMERNWTYIIEKWLMWKTYEESIHRVRCIRETVNSEGMRSNTGHGVYIKAVTCI